MSFVQMSMNMRGKEGQVGYRSRTADKKRKGNMTTTFCLVRGKFTPYHAISLRSYLKQRSGSGSRSSRHILPALVRSLAHLALSTMAPPCCIDRTNYSSHRGRGRREMPKRYERLSVISYVSIIRPHLSPFPRVIVIIILHAT